MGNKQNKDRRMTGIQSSESDIKSETKSESVHDNRAHLIWGEMFVSTEKLKGNK